MYDLNPTMSRLSLLLHESEVKLRMSVNNNDNLRVQWDLSGFYPSAFDVYNNHDQLLIVSNTNMFCPSPLCLRCDLQPFVMYVIA